MSNLIGKNLKILNALDRAAADDLSVLYTIEVILTKSVQKKVKCGALAIFKLNDIPEMDFKESADPLEIFQAQKELNNMTDRMYRDPEYFRESDGRWLRFALNRTLQVFDELGTNADIVIKAPKLKIKHRITRSEVLSLRHEHKKLFWVAFDIDELLDGKFSYDPWRGVIRRGDIGAKK
jgi:hypothetical protein